MPAEPPFLRLCSQVDVASLVLQKLSPKALACLGSCCAALRTLVDSQPEALWQAAAGLSGYSGTHPVRQAPCVRAYLRQQHRVHSKLASAQYQAHHLQLPEGLVSPNCSKHAAVVPAGPRTRVCIRALPSGAVLHRWPVPAKHAWVDCQQWSCWDLQSGMLALAYGGAWGYYRVDADDCAGLILLNTASGHVVDVQLPSQEESVDWQEYASVHGWSSAQQLLVKHDNHEGDRVLSVFDATGKVVAAFWPPLEERHSYLVRDDNCWSPNGQHILLHFIGGEVFWIWDVQADSVQQHSFAGRAPSHVWSPSGDVLFYSDRAVALFDVAQRQMYTQQLDPAQHAVWGEHGLALLSTSSVGAHAQPEFSMHLRLYQVSHQELLLTHSVEVARTSERYLLAHLTMAPDGRHFMLSGGRRVSNPEYDPEDENSDQSICVHWRLLAADCMTGRTKQLWAEPTGSRTASWGAGGSCVFISEWEGEQHVLLDFS